MIQGIYAYHLRTTTTTDSVGYPTLVAAKAALKHLVAREQGHGANVICQPDGPWISYQKPTGSVTFWIEDDTGNAVSINDGRNKMTRPEYVTAFPAYCRKCEGWGAHKQLQPRVIISDCTCVQEGQCPRCGVTKETFELSRDCAECGWNMDDKERGLPGSNVV
jgi:hypothetical protein